MIRGQDILWNIYNKTFEPLNVISPCKQSFDQTHFMELLIDESVKKFILSKENIGILGLALITNDLKNTPWISEEYFKFKFPEKYSEKKVYYFVGLAIDKKFRGNKYSISLIEKVIDNLPENSVMGFDHSKNINPLLHHFTKIIRQSRLINRTHIDQQHYHVVEWKNKI